MDLFVNPLYICTCAESSAEHFRLTPQWDLGIAMLSIEVLSFQVPTHSMKSTALNQAYKLHIQCMGRNRCLKGGSTKASTLKPKLTDRRCCLAQQICNYLHIVEELQQERMRKTHNRTSCKATVGAQQLKNASLGFVCWESRVPEPVALHSQTIDSLDH